MWRSVKCLQDVLLNVLWSEMERWAKRACWFRTRLTASPENMCPQCLIITLRPWSAIAFPWAWGCGTLPDRKITTDSDPSLTHKYFHRITQVDKAPLNIFLHDRLTCSSYASAWSARRRLRTSRRNGIPKSSTTAPMHQFFWSGPKWICGKIAKRWPFCPNRDWRPWNGSRVWNWHQRSEPWSIWNARLLPNEVLNRCLTKQCGLSFDPNHRSEGNGSVCFCRALLGDHIFIFATQVALVLSLIVSELRVAIHTQSSLLFEWKMVYNTYFYDTSTILQPICNFTSSIRRMCQ